jgi:hypothetical protein
VPQPGRGDVEGGHLVVDDPDRQPDLAHVRDLPKRLTAETRAAILVVKEAWAGRPEYRRDVRSWDI